MDMKGKGIKELIFEYNNHRLRDEEWIILPVTKTLKYKLCALECETGLPKEETVLACIEVAFENLVEKECGDE